MKTEGGLTEIRWHGRGGQGAKTAATLMAEAAAAAGMFVQGFPEYGPERMGAPLLAFNRVSSEPITVHCQVYEPDVVVVLDPSLLDSVPVAEGLKEAGAIIVNTSEAPETIAEQLGLEASRVYTVDATDIAVDSIGRPIPNTPMMGALIRVTGVMERDRFLAEARELLKTKFGDREELVSGNVEAISRAYEEVRSA
jgi:pyruvate ferredoxin oxidoreductase gamma subunit